MSYIHSIQTEIVSLAKGLNLPELYKGDIETDVKGIERYQGHQLVWLLRTCGTVLVPAKVGVDPVYITHWLWGDHGQKVVCFSIDTLTGLIEKIDYEKAEQLIMQLPYNLSHLTDKEQLAQKVNDVLERGCAMGIWGIFKSPSSVEDIGGWSDWLNYFNSINNKLMANFMGKAIRIVNPR